MVSTHLTPQDVSIFGDEPFNAVDFHILDSRPCPIHPKLTSGGLGDFTHTHRGETKNVSRNTKSYLTYKPEVLIFT